MNASARSTLLPESRFVRLLRWTMLLGLVHIFVALNLIPIAGRLGAMIYTVFPPVIFWLIGDFAARAPTLCLLALGPCLMLAPVLIGPLRARVVSWTRSQRALLWTALAIWLPIASAEAVRAVLIQAQLAAASPRCERSESLLASLRKRLDFDIDGRNAPGTWMVRDDDLLLWSDRTLRFEPVVDMDRRPELPAACLRGGAPVGGAPEDVTPYADAPGEAASR